MVMVNVEFNGARANFGLAAPRPNLRWIDSLEKYVLVLRTRNWRTLAKEGWPGIGFLRRPMPTLYYCAIEEGRIAKC
ncbi:hypothetical protein TNCV_4690251 [Trichonephila clavipes]|nr:hypothetical protein TNCV_4690251 [Trichonephila clavipes]